MVVIRSERTDVLLPADAAFASAYESLPDWRRRKCDAFRFSADRRRSVAVWLLLRQMLSERGLNADSMPVTENTFGKPSFAPGSGLHFNLSHSRDRVMAVLSDSEIGCDVEKAAPVDDGMLDICLAKDERRALEGLSGEARDRAFFRLWVRKESYVKAIGRGICFGLRGVPALGASPDSGWVWRDFDFGDGHLGCVCEAASNCCCACDLRPFAGQGGLRLERLRPSGMECWR